MSEISKETPRGNVEGFTRYFSHDVVSGVLVFLIALPLCLGISLASGFPPLAGIFTAIIGAIVTTFISNSELTIKGPAAGLIVIVLGCIEEFGGDGMTGGFTDADMTAYKATLAVGCAAAVLQILFGVVRAGILGEFFPVSAVHGMLAAIGVIIISKQIPVALGVQAKGEPLELLREIPHFIMEANPAIASIGIMSLLIMFLWPTVRARVKLLRNVPAPLIVLTLSIGMGMGFDLLHEHSYVLQGHKYQLGEQYLVRMPDRIFGMFSEVTTPDFTALSRPVAWKWVMMFFIIGSLESILSAKAIDIIDPWKRKTNMNRDVLAVGTANLFASLAGGLPMISEIVRSKANIDNGARTRFADLWHGLCLLACVALIPTLLHRIPLAALAAMLVYTGFRLAHPSEFLHVYHIGREQLIVFVTTLIGVLATDLLIGIAIGIFVKLVIHLMNGVPLKSLFKTNLEIEPWGDNTVLIRAHQSAVFSNWIPFRRQIEDLGLAQHQNIVVNLSDTRFVDHSTMNKLYELERDFEQEGLTLEIIGLDLHQPLAHHQRAARKKLLPVLRRLTVITRPELEEHLVNEFRKLGAADYTSIPCTGRLSNSSTNSGSESLKRIEVLVPENISDNMILFLRREMTPDQVLNICVENVRVVPVGSQAHSGNGQLVHH